MVKNGTAPTAFGWEWGTATYLPMIALHKEL